MKSLKSRRQHPIRIIFYTTKNFWLLSIPLLRGLIALQFDFATWAKGAWLDILIIFFILFVAVLRWAQISFSFNNDSMALRRGFLYRSNCEILYSKIASVCIENKFLLRPLRASTVLIDTNSGTKSQADIKLILRKPDIDAFVDALNSNSNSAPVSFKYTPLRRHLFFFSFVFSNTLSGVILVATLLYQGGKIVGREIESQFYNKFNSLTESLTTIIPPSGIALAALIIFGWTVSFTLNLLRYWNFHIERQGEKILVKSGFATKRIYYLNSHKINYVDFQQSLLTMIFRIFSVHIHCTGYGKAKRSEAVLIPITTRKNAIRTLHILIPQLPHPKTEIKSGIKQLHRYIGLPLIYVIGIPAVMLIALYIFPKWDRLIIFISILFELPFIWLLVVKIVSTFTTSIGLSKNTLTLKYCEKYAFHTLLVPLEKVAMIKIYQSIFQKNSNNCDLYIYTNSEHTKYHRIRFLRYDQIIDFIKKIR